MAVIVTDEQYSSEVLQRGCVVDVGGCLQPGQDILAADVRQYEKQKNGKPSRDQSLRLGYVSRSKQRERHKPETVSCGQA